MNSALNPAGEMDARLWACDQRDARTLGPGLLNDARNLRYTDGVPTTRRGVTKPGWANLTTAGSVKIGSLGVPFGAGVFSDPNGVEWQIIAADGYIWRTRPHNQAVVIPMPTAVAIASKCKFVQAFDKLFCFRGRFRAPLVMSNFDEGFVDIVQHLDPQTVYQATVVASGLTADEIAYGPFVDVVSLVNVSTVVTVKTTTAHGFANYQDVTIVGASPDSLNGRWEVSVQDDNTFSYGLNFPLADVTATGTIRASNMSHYWRALGSQKTLTSLVRQLTAAFTLTSLTSPAAFTLTSATCPTSFDIVALTHVGTTATATVPNHGLFTGESVTVTGAVHTAFNGTFAITVTNANQFTYICTGGTPGGNEKAICFGTASYGTIALATKAGHGLTTGDTVTIAGATPTDYNGTFSVTVTSPSQFTYQMLANPQANATGTITVTPAKSIIATATKASHGLPDGGTVTIAGATPAAYNGTYIITRISADQFSYTFAGGTSPATGTIQVTATTGNQALATAAAHGFLNGDTVTISGASPAGYNGTFIISVLNADQFSYTMGTNPSSDATGLVTAQTSRVLAGQTPDSNPEAWARTYNILPNADTALFINDLLLVPTAYEPSSADNYNTFNGGQYKRVDYLVATNYLDYVHFSFSNEFRINAGSADEIVDLFKFGPNTVIVLKGKSWAVLSNVAGDLTQVTLDIRSTEYGCVAPDAWTVVGSNAYFLTATQGLVAIRQTDLGVLVGVNVPLTAPIQKTLNQVDWITATTRARVAYWQNKLYLALPLKDGSHVIAVFDFIASVRLGNNAMSTGVEQQGWTPIDTGAALDVQEFFKLTLNGQERLFFLDTAGYVNLMEESDTGDQVANAGAEQGLSWAEIESYSLSRAYAPSLNGQIRPVEEGVSLMTWNPSYTVRAVFPDVNRTTTVVNALTRSRTRYTRPFYKTAWDPSNVNLDWNSPAREDYSVAVPTGGLYFDPGVSLLQFQEALDTRRISGRQSKSFQLEITNTQGRVKLVGQRVSAVPGRDSRGVSI